MSKQFLLLGRWCFGAIFIMSGFSHFTAQTQAMALQRGVPPWLTMAAGLLACAGGLSVALGYRARVGGWLIAAFLVPVTLTMHAFWAQTDPQASMLQLVEFMKNLSMFGGALMVAYFGSGPFSLDNGSRHPAARTIESVRHREPALR